MSWGETVHPEQDQDLIPLKSSFDVTWRGYRRSQVQFYVQQTETELEILGADRDAAMAQVNDLRAELARTRAYAESLRAQLDVTSAEEIDESVLNERLRRVVRAAEAEAANILTSARSAAQREWADAKREASQLRVRYEEMIAEAISWQEQWETQRAEALRRARQDAEEFERLAAAHRQELDEQARRERRAADRDFHTALAARRREASEKIARDQEQNRREAAERVHVATVEANRRLAAAMSQVQALRDLHRDLQERVSGARELLRGVLTQLDAELDEDLREEESTRVNGIAVPDQRLAGQIGYGHAVSPEVSGNGNGADPAHSVKPS